MKRKIISLILVVSMVFSISVISISIGQAETRKLPKQYTLVYRGENEQYFESLGGRYMVSVHTGSVSLISQTTASILKISSNTLYLPLDIYRIVSNGYYDLEISGYLDKKVLSGELKVTKEKAVSYNISTYYGVVYVYITYSGDPVTISLSKGDIVLKQVSATDGYGLLTATTDIGNYHITFNSKGSSEVNYLIAYSDGEGYSATPMGIYKVKVMCIASCGLDGDTIKVKMGTSDVKVRLIGINTPEIEHNGKPAECYGNEARAFTDSHLNGRWLYLEFDKEVFDKYHRYLAYVWLTYPELYDPEIYMWNSVLAKEGYAKVLSLMPNITYAWLFNKLQYQARHLSKGLWGACGD